MFYPLTSEPIESPPICEVRVPNIVRNYESDATHHIVNASELLKTKARYVADWVMDHPGQNGVCGENEHVLFGDFDGLSRHGYTDLIGYDTIYEAFSKALTIIKERLEEKRRTYNYLVVTAGKEPNPLRDAILKAQIERVTKTLAYAKEILAQAGMQFL